MTPQIHRLRMRLVIQRKVLLHFRKQATTCKDSRLWSMHMHECKAAKKRLAQTAEALKVLLRLNRDSKRIFVADPHNDCKGHYFLETQNGLRYNQTINGTIQYDWQDCDERHGYYWLYEQHKHPSGFYEKDGQSFITGWALRQGI